MSVAAKLKQLGLGQFANNPAGLQRVIADRLFALEREMAERSLSDFIRQAWRHIDPAKYRHNWHIDAIAEHLEAVARREIARGLIINIPPRRMKSISVNVMYPAWTWAQDPDPDQEGHGLQIRPGTWMGPGVRFLSASYAVTLATRDNVKCRRILESPWFQKNWPRRVTFAPDQNTKRYYENQQGGARYATGVDAQVTGEGGDVGLIDDPINVADANSPVAIDNVIVWWDEAMPTRLNDATHGVFIVIMQRCHTRDLTGHILAKELGFDHLCLPEIYEADHPFPVRSSIGFKDPRGEGEFLWKERFGREEYDKLTLSEYGKAGQMQQRPAPREGGLFKRAWFEVVDVAPATRRTVRRWDLAGTEDKPGADPDYTVGLKLSVDANGVYYVEHVRRFRGDPFRVEQEIKATASQDGKRVRIGLPQDPGQAGKSQARYLVRQLAGYVVTAKPESGSKTVRAEPVASQAAAGNVKLVRDKQGDLWIEAFLDELGLFPFGDHDDQVDALSGAFDDLTSGPGKSGIAPLTGGY